MAGRLSEQDQAKFGVDSYTNLGATRTKANSTLFVAFRDVKNVPAAERASKAEELFSAVPGYVGVRQVRSMCCASPKSK